MVVKRKVAPSINEAEKIRSRESSHVQDDPENLAPRIKSTTILPNPQAKSTDYELRQSPVTTIQQRHHRPPCLSSVVRSRTVSLPSSFTHDHDATDERNEMADGQITFDLFIAIDAVSTQLDANNFTVQFILRLLNTNVDGKEKIMYALTRIKGVGRRYSNLVCKKADVDLSKRYVHTKQNENTTKRKGEMLTIAH